MQRKVGNVIHHGDSTKVDPILAKHTQGAQERHPIETQGPMDCSRRQCAIMPCLWLRQGNLAIDLPLITYRSLGFQNHWCALYLLTDWLLIQYSSTSLLGRFYIDPGAAGSARVRLTSCHCHPPGSLDAELFTRGRKQRPTVYARITTELFRTATSICFLLQICRSNRERKCGSVG